LIEVDGREYEIVSAPVDAASAGHHLEAEVRKVGS